MTHVQGKRSFSPLQVVSNRVIVACFRTCRFTLKVAGPSVPLDFVRFSVATYSLNKDAKTFQQHYRSLDVLLAFYFLLSYQDSMSKVLAKAKLVSGILYHCEIWFFCPFYIP